jgi:hypothetical protein
VRFADRPKKARRRRIALRHAIVTRMGEDLSLAWNREPPEEHWGRCE